MAHKAPTHRPPFWTPAPKNPNPEHSFYHTSRWQKTRARVLRRDGFQCTDPMCTTPERGRGSRLTVHHTRGREGDLAWAEEFMVTVCPACHARAHPEKGYR